MPARALFPGAIASACGVVLVTTGFGAYVAASSRYTAVYGTLAGVVVEVTQASSAPVAVVVHPAGKAGAATPSKFWVKNGVPPHGIGVGLGQTRVR